MAEISLIKLSETQKYHRLDAGFYQPQYQIDFSKGSWEPIKRHLDVCQYGISQAMLEEPAGFPIFRMDDIKVGFLVNDDIKYVEISEHVFKQYKLEIDDVLFNRVNSEDFVGRTGIFKLKGDYVFASYLIRLRVRPNSTILPDYLNMFLNTRYGKRQIRRFLRRAVNQANVNAEELKNFKIAIIDNEIQKEVSRLSDEAWKHIELSKALYFRAEDLLLEGLGLKGFKLKHKLSYIASLSRASGARRMDAEYFQPAYDELVARISSRAHYIVRKIQTFNRRGVQPQYASNGEIKVVTSKRLGNVSIDYENLESCLLDEWDRNAEARIRENDILIYTTGAYVGKTNCFLENTKALASNHVNILRVQELNPSYVAVFLNSILGQTQVRKYVSGSAQAELYPTDIAKFAVWKAPEKTQHDIASLVQKSYEARKTARNLLNEAKRKAEEAIDTWGA